MDGHNLEDSKQSTADMSVFVQNLLQQMQSRFQTMSESIITKSTKILIMVRGKAQMRRIENDTSSNQQTIERYRRHTKDNETNKPIEQNLQHLKTC